MFFPDQNNSSVKATAHSCFSLMARRKDTFRVELLAQLGLLAVLHTGVSLAEGMQRAPWVSV